MGTWTGCSDRTGNSAEQIPDSVTDMLKNDKYQLLLVNSEYKVASDELNAQIKDLNKILHK